MSRGLPSFLLLVLLFSGCSRHRDRKDAKVAPQQSPTVAAGPAQPFTKIAASTNDGAIERPSPFTTHTEADRQEPLPSTPAPLDIEPAPTPSNRDFHSARKPMLRKPLKAFIPQTADISHDRVPLLPGPPPLPSAALSSAPTLPFRDNHDKPVVGTATLEAARPGGLRRVLGVLPGVRRLHQTPESQEGYIAAKPARNITLVLPSQARAILREGGMDLKATVDESGRVTRVQLLSPKDEELIRLASYAAGAWPFTPARLNDKPVPSEVFLHFNFSGN